MKNYGVIHTGRRPRDFVAGALPYQVRNVSGNWRDFLPSEEKQKGAVDSMACVTFSLLNCIETQEFQQTGRRVNYSDRWIAMMSGTTVEGNTLVAVLDTVRKYGLVKEESWPAPENFTWSQYYAVPTPTQMEQLKAEGKRWLETHSLDYEWIPIEKEQILYHLKHAPLQVVRPGHVIEGFYQVGDTHHYFDTYYPFQRTIKYTSLEDVLKPVLTVKMPQFKTQKKGAELRIVLQAADLQEWAALCRVYGVDPTTFDEIV